MARTTEEILGELGLKTDGSFTDSYNNQKSGATNGKNGGTRTSADILAELGLEAKRPYQDALAANRQKAQSTKQTAGSGDETLPAETHSGWTDRGQYNDLLAQRARMQEMYRQNGLRVDDWQNIPAYQELNQRISEAERRVNGETESPMQQQAEAILAGKHPGSTVPKATAQADGTGRSSLLKPSAIRGNGRAGENEPLHHIAEEDRAYNVDTARAAMEQAQARLDAAKQEAQINPDAHSSVQAAEQAYNDAAYRYYMLDDSWVDELYNTAGGSEDNGLRKLGQTRDALQEQHDQLVAQRRDIEEEYLSQLLTAGWQTDPRWTKLDTEIKALETQISGVKDDIAQNYDYNDLRINDTQQKALETISEREMNALDNTVQHVESLTGHSLEETFEILNKPESEEYAELMQELGTLGVQQLSAQLEALSGSYDKIDKCQTVLGNDSDTFSEAMNHAFVAGMNGIVGGTEGSIAWLKEAAIRLGYKQEGTPEERERLAQLDAQMQDIVTEYGGGMGYEQDPRYIAAQQEQRELTAQLQNQRGEYAMQETQDVYSRAQEHLDQRNALLQQAKQNAGAFQSVAVDLVENGTEMLPDTIVSILSAGTGNPVVVACAQNIALALMGVRVFGSENAELQAQGKGFLERTVYAGISTGIEIFTEKMFDGLGGIYGKGMVGMEGKELFDIWQDQMIASISDASKRPAAAVVASLFFGFLGEGTEEVVSSLCEPITNLIIMSKEEWLKNYGIDESNGWLYDYGKAIENSGEEIGYSFFIGGLMGLFGTVTQIGGTYSEEANTIRLNKYLSGEATLAEVCTEEMREMLKARGVEGDEAINEFGAAFLEEMKTDGVTAADITDDREAFEGMTAAAGVMHPGDTVPKAIAQADGSVSPMQEQAAAAIAPQGTGREAENTPINAVAEADGAGRTFEQAGGSVSPMQEQAAAAIAPAEQTAQVEQALVASGMAPEQAAQVAQQAATLGQQPAETQREEQAPALQQGSQSSEIERTVDFSQQSISDIRSYLENNLQQSGGIVGEYRIDITPGAFGTTNISIANTETGETTNLQGDGFTDENAIAEAIYKIERGNENARRSNLPDRRQAEQQDGRSARITVGTVSGSAESIRQRATAIQRQTRGKAGTYEARNSKDLLNNGDGTDADVKIIPEQDYDDEMRSISEEIEKRFGFKPIFILGGLEVKDGLYANGFSKPDRIIIQADHPEFSVTQIGRHEAFHQIKRKNRTLYEGVSDYISSKLTEQEKRTILDYYTEAYGNLASTKNADEYAWDEICCDFYAGLTERYTGLKLSDEIVNGIRELAEDRTERSQQSNGTEEATGPPVNENVDNVNTGIDDNNRNVDELNNVAEEITPEYDERAEAEAAQAAEENASQAVEEEPVAETFAEEAQRQMPTLEETSVSDEQNVEDADNTVAETFAEEVQQQTKNSVAEQPTETVKNVAERGERSPQQKAMLEARGETFEESKKNTASEETEETDNAALVRQIKNAIPELENMEPVATVTGNEIQKEGRVSDRIWNFVKTIGTIVRKNFGQVEISRGKVKSSFVGHGIGGAKIDIFPAVPKVIESGKQIGFAKNWKGRTYDTYIFAAPVIYKGDRTYVGVIVQKDSNSNRYYLHEVVDENGNIIYENKEAPSSTSDRPSALASDRDTVIDGGASLEESSSNEIIAPSETESKGEKAKPRKKTAKKASSKSKEDLQDFGEKIGGAKKDTWRKRGLSLDDLAQMNEAERGKYTKKDSVWPKCNYEDMVSNGATREAAYFVKLMRDGIPTAPIVKYNSDVDAARSEYIEFVQKMRDGLMKIKSQADIAEFIENVVIKEGYAKISEDYKGRPYLRRGEKFTYDGYFNTKMLEACQNGMQGAAVLGKLADKKQFLVKQEDKIPAGMEIHQFDGKGWTKSGNWEVGTYYITKGPFIIQTNFKDYQTALAYAQQIAGKKGSNGKKKFVPPQLENVHRVGRDVRENNTRNVTGEDLLETFKFKGGEFGNWLNQQDRQVSLNYAYDALTDLADLLGISPADISLGGELSIAFGSRGEKGAAAHYESERTVINLTKMNGAGSLGHEWAHALDNMLGRQYSKPGSDTFATDIARRTEIESLKTLVDDMKYKPMDGEKAKAKAEKEVENYKNRLNAWLAGYFSTSVVNNMTYEQAEKYKQLVEGILSGAEAHDDWYFNPDSGLVKEISDFRKELTNRGIPKEDRQSLASYMHQLNAKMKFAEAPTSKEETDFYKGSKAFGKDYSRGMGDGYWDSDIEMFARAFACYLHDKAAGIDCRSDYLAGHSESAVTLDDKGNVVAAIPQGAERLKLNEDFDNLIAELKDKGILHAPQEEAEEYNVARYSLSDGDSAASNTALEEDADDVVQAPDGTLAVRISSAESGLNQIRKGRWASEIARQIRTQLAGRAIIAADGDIIRITERGAREVPYGTNSNNLFREEPATHEKFNRKMITAEHAASIISLSRYSEWTANNEDLTDMFKRDGLNKRVVSLFIDDEPYTAYVLTALNDDPNETDLYGEKFYDIVGIEKQTNQPALSGAAITMEASPHKIKYADGSSDMLTINQKNRIVNNREHGITYSGAGTETDTDIPEWQRRLAGITFDDNGDMNGSYSLSGGEEGKREWSGVQGLDLGGLTPDQYIEKAMARAAADRADRLRTISRDEFKGTESLEKLGVKISGSAGVYERLEMLKQADKMAKSIRKQTDRIEKRLKPTQGEMAFAKGIASGIYNRANIPADMNKKTVEELADFYFAEQGTGSDLISRQKRDIAITLDAKMQQMMNGVDTEKMPKALPLNLRTPARSMRQIFGDKNGERIYQEIFKPVEENEAERYRFINRQFDDVREFTDSTGRKRPLNKTERSVVQLIIEHKAAGQAVAEMEMSDDNTQQRQAQLIKAAAEQILRGTYDASMFESDAKAAELAQSYAQWTRAQELISSGKADNVKCMNAAEAYSAKFAEFYGAINDFLTAHGYEPIGFIKNYAPHMQDDTTKTMLQKTFEAMGMTSDVTNLPTEIAGTTASYKPNKRWNPYFLSRNNGQNVKADIASAYESYVEYLSDILYHTDDIMRVRAFERYLRSTYSANNIRDNIDVAKALRSGRTEDQIKFLQQVGKVAKGTSLTADDARKAIDDYLSEQFANMDNKTTHGALAAWLTDYANKLAGKQLSYDRGWEGFAGRKSLNIINRLQRQFAMSQVGGKVSSVLNQGAQLPQIYAELGSRYTLLAAKDAIFGHMRRNEWGQRSDFLTGKNGINYIVTDTYGMITNWLFTGADIMDGLVSTIAVRGRYLKAINEGMSESEAMKVADKFGNEVMGSRMKGTKPLAFESKDPFIRMATMFQVEALNSWDHIIADLPRDFREIEEKYGRAKAAMSLAGVILKALVSAFALNRLDDELYGGTPAPYDILGLTANFIASGNGLTTNDMLLSVINEAWRKGTGEYLFDEDSIFGDRGMQYGNLEDGEFSLEAAVDDAQYNLMNEIPMLSNVAAILGKGDKSLPLAGLNTVGDVFGTGFGMITGKNEYTDFLEALALGAAEFLPGGSQAKRTVQGVQAFAKGGKYDSKGNLQYAVGDDPLTAARMAIFGQYSTPEAQSYYAAKDAGLSAGLTGATTRVFKVFTENGYGNLQAQQLTEQIKGALNGDPKQADVESVLRSMGLSNDLAAAIWQNFNKGWSPKNNPFSVNIGQQVWDELNGGK